MHRGRAPSPESTRRAPDRRSRLAARPPAPHRCARCAAAPHPAAGRCLWYAGGGAARRPGPVEPDRGGIRTASMGHCRVPSCRTPRRCLGAHRGGTTTAAAPGCSTRWSRGGEVARARREGRLPLWDLAERVYAVRAAVRLHHRVGPRSRPSRRPPRGRPLERRPPATGQSRGEVACGVDGSAHVSELIR